MRALHLLWCGHLIVHPLCRDYFRRIDEQQAEAADTPAGNHALPSVERFSLNQINQLPKSVYHAASCAYTECSVCLSDFVEGERLTMLPCAAGHLLHTACAEGCLARSVFCPLCRVDLSAILPSDKPQREVQPPLSPRQLGYTRDGGFILRYEPNPPQDMPRPDYIPTESHSTASFVEIQYPERGVARIWRVPRSSREVQM